ncbi:MAG: hypothetical protein AABY33_03765 [Pseudomonadota bacterium]
MFTSEITEHLRYYVYRLIDPRNGQTFYIGKGLGNRVFAHVKGESESADNAINVKLQRIREIRLSGFDVAHVIHRHGLDEQTAFEVESALIDAYPEAANLISGHDTDDRGVMHAQQIIERYQAEEIVFHHKVLMINIGRSATEKESIYEAVRYAWKIDPKKARQAELVLAMQQGLVVGVFIAEKWLEATPENFMGREALLGMRWGFIGCEAAADIAKIYLRKRLPDSMRKRGAANPIKYKL